MADRQSVFAFKQFVIHQDRCAMKVGTDGVLLGAWARGGSRILDVGTGTGLIALMLAQRYPDGSVTAIDIDEAAARQAAENAAQSPFADRVSVACQPVQEHCGCYDAVVCNPPFFIGSLPAPDRRRSLARHAETLTYEQLMTAGNRLLDDDGELSVVVPFDYRKRMEDAAIIEGFFPSRVCAVKTVARKSARRYLLAFRRTPCQCEHEELVVGDEAYGGLTEAFYLNS